MTAAALALALFAAAPTQAADAKPQAAEIKIVLLGTGAPAPRIDRFGPSTLVEAGSERLLFDAGRGASQRLWQLGIPLGSVTAVFLTHLHSDHVVGLPDLWLTGWLATPFGGRTTSLEVRGPAGTSDMMAALRRAFDWDIAVRAGPRAGPGDEAGVSYVARDVKEGLALERNGVKVIAFEVDHGPELRPAFGYRVEYGGRAIVISGDTRVSENLVRRSAGVDVLVHEVAAARKELVERSPLARGILGLHTSPEDAGRVFARVKPRLAVYTHVVLLTTDPAIGPPPVEEVIERTRATYAGSLVAGEDLMTIVVGDTVEVRRFTPTPR